jgi:hypothetical protein
MEGLQASWKKWLAIGKCSRGSTSSCGCYNYSSFHEYIFNCVVEILEEKIKMRQGEEKLRKMHNNVNQ